MKRGWLAIMIVAVGLAGTGRADPPERLPVTPEHFGQSDSNVVPQTNGGGSSFASDGGGGETKQSQPEQIGPPNTAGPVTPNVQGPNVNQQPQKPSLEDYHAGPCEHLWVSVSYLIWKIPNAPNQTPLATDAAGNTILGGDTINFGTFSGIRLAGGAWLDCRHVYGIELGGFITEQQSRFSGVASDAAGNPTIIRPFIDALTGLPSTDPVRFVSFPGFLSGRLDVSASARVDGAEANIIRNVASCPNWSFSVLAGFRYLDLEEDLTISQHTSALVDGVLFFNNNNVGVSDIAIQDRFHTRNQFYGGQVGAKLEAIFGIWYGNITAKVALGPNHQVADLSGRTTATVFDTQQVANSGLLVAGDVPGIDVNGGRAVTNWFVVVPEVGARIGCQVSNHWRLFVGYNFLYVNNVVRPGDLINSLINSRFVPASSAFGTLSGPNEPRLLVRRDDFFIHGVEFGVELKY